MTTPSSERRGPGRPRDDSRDADILRATRDELSATGYEGMTMAAVAARAGASKATVYRRWGSKAELVIDAVAGHLDAAQVLERVPDTGSLAGDLHALRALKINDQQLWQALPGLAVQLQKTPEVAPLVRDRLVGPRVDIIRGLLERARARGELRPRDADTELLAQIPAAVVTYRLFIMGEPVDTDFLVKTCEEVLIPLAT